MAMKLLLVILFSVSVVALSACSLSDYSSAAVVVSDFRSEAAPRIENVKLASGDKIRVAVFGEDSISGEYDVDTEGYVALPLAGSVMAAGLTKADLEKALAAKLSAYLRTPRVTVSISSFRPFYILGEVEKPGEYQYKSGLNVISAMALAGGSTYRASKSKVLVQRNGVGEFKEYPMSPQVKVFPGDLIRIPERFF
jgi:polysaccharide export outer membrane protein